MTRPVPAPDVPGYTFVRALKAGGFAGVFVYRQAVPDREVAVKVLGERFAGEERMRRFHAEANVTASLSTHPNIITIYQAGVTSAGRPYLVMEFCPGADMADRVKIGPLAVAEVLRIGIRVAGAVETAHRAGILHRDIKPANILTAAGNRPVLTDFGIAAALSGAAGTEGLSVPWSPPESLRDPGSTTTPSDVYSLAATLWHLLVRRSPFAVPGGPNGQADLIHRITNTLLPRLDRDDVPPGLERLLTVAMAKRPEDRPQSAMEFARSLQHVAGQAGYPETPVEILDLTPSEHSTVPVDDDEPGTQVRRIVTVDPDADPTRERADLDADEKTSLGTRRHTLTAYEPTASAAATGRQRAVFVAPPVEDTQVRDRPAVQEGPPPPEPARRGRTLLLAAAGLLVAGGVTAVVLLNGAESPAAGPKTPAPEPDGGSAIVAVVPGPSGLSGARQADGSVLFTWEATDRQDGDSWVVRRVDPGADDRAQLVDQPSVTLTGVAAGAQACVEVAIRRVDGRMSAEPAEACAG